MNQIKRFGKIFAIVLMLSMAVQLVLPNYLTAVANAAAVAINPQKVTLEAGKTKLLKVTGTKAKAVWKSNNPKVAAVSKTGLVTAIKAGKATITATINKKAYTCSVTVTEVKKNPLVDAAPFKAQVATTDAATYIFPSNWNKYETEVSGYKQVTLVPKSAIVSGKASNLVILLADIDSPIDADSLKPVYDAITADALVAQFAQLGMEVTIDNLTVDTYKTDLGLGYVTKYELKYNGVSMKQAIYDIYTNKHVFKTTVTDIGDNLTPDINQVADYFFSTVKISE